MGLADQYICHLLNNTDNILFSALLKNKYSAIHVSIIKNLHYNEITRDFYSKQRDRCFGIDLDILGIPIHVSFTVICKGQKLNLTCAGTWFFLEWDF